MRAKAALYLLFGVCMMLSLLPGTVSGQVQNPQGELQHTQASDIWGQTLEGGYFNEFWTYHFFLEDDIKMHITFSVANFGSLKDPVSGVRISVFNFDGETHQISREYSLDRLIQDEENHRFQVSEDRDVWFEGKLPESHRVRVETGKGGQTFDIDMNFNTLVQGVKWSNGLYSIGQEPVGIYTHIPFAEVSGSVEINGTRKELSGTAYMDHTFQNQTTTQLMHSGYRFISHTDAQNWDITYALLPDKHDEMRVIGHRLKSEQGQQTLQSAYQIMDMQRKRDLGERYADRMQLYLLELPIDDGGASIINIQRTQNDERFSILSDLSWIARRAARRFLGGEVIELRGEAVLEEMGKEPKPGYYNFFIVE